MRRRSDPGLLNVRCYGNWTLRPPRTWGEKQCRVAARSWSGRCPIKLFLPISLRLPLLDRWCRSGSRFRIVRNRHRYQHGRGNHGSRRQSRVTVGRLAASQHVATAASTEQSAGECQQDKASDHAVMITASALKINALPCSRSRSML